MSRSVFVLLLSLVSFFSATSVCWADDLPHEEWEVLYIANQRVGYGRSNVVQTTRDRKTIYVSKHEGHLSIKRFGQHIKFDSLSISEEDEDGKLLSFKWEFNNPPAQSTLSKGTVSDSTLRIENTVNGRTTTQVLRLDPDVQSMAYQDRQLRKKPLKPGESRTFKEFVPEFSKVGTVKITADELRSVKLHDNSERSLLKLRVTQSLFPGIEMQKFVDEQGQVLRSDSSALGIVTYSVSRDVALQAISGAELDLALGSLIKVPNPPVTLIKAKKTVLKLTSSDVDLGQAILPSLTQSVKRLSDGAIEVSLTAYPVPTYLPGIPSRDKNFLGETTYLQTKDRRVQEHAERAAAGSEDVGTIALRMERYVFEKLTKKNFSTALASAAEVAERMEGDCTEHACLLAAMLRAKQIPSRVAVGLVYADKLGAFGGHMWTEALIDGKWVPVDGTLGIGGIGASHIKLGDSDLSDAGPIPVASFLPLWNIINNVKIEVVSVVK